MINIIITLKIQNIFIVIINKRTRTITYIIVFNRKFFKCWTVFYMTNIIIILIKISIGTLANTFFLTFYIISIFVLFTSNTIIPFGKTHTYIFRAIKITSFCFIINFITSNITFWNTFICIINNIFISITFTNTFIPIMKRT